MGVMTEPGELCLREKSIQVSDGDPCCIRVSAIDLSDQTFHFLSFFNVFTNAGT